MGPGDRPLTGTTTAENRRSFAVIQAPGGVGKAALVFAVACAARLFIYAFGGHRSLVGDETFYWDFAHRMMEGKFSTWHFMPGWPLLMTLPLTVADSLAAVRLFNVALGSLACVFVYLLAERVFLDGRKAFVAGLLFALYPEHVFLSHYLYAEVGLSLILAFISLLLFRRAPGLETRDRLVASLLFGAGVLFKHFAVLSFAGALVVAAKGARRRWPLVLGMLAAFALPIGVYSAARGATGKDAAKVLRAPLKSANEWHLNRIGPGPKERDVNKAIGDFGETLVEADSGYVLYRIYRSVRRLWGVEAIAAREIKQGRYAAWVEVPPVSFVIKTFYLGLLLAGVTGLFFGAPSPFRSYAGVTLGLLTAMSLQFFMVSRYRLPFMFLVAILAAEVLASPGEVRRRYEWATPFKRRAWAVVVVLLSVNALMTWS